MIKPIVGVGQATSDIITGSGAKGWDRQLFSDLTCSLYDSVYSNVCPAVSTQCKNMAGPNCRVQQRHLCRGNHGLYSQAAT